MIEVKCTDPTDFEFDMQLNGGAVGAIPQVIFCVDIGAWGLTFPCIKGERGMHSVRLPSFCSLNIAPGEYSCRIMVLLGDSVFFPYADTLHVKDDPKPVINTFAPKAAAPVAPTIVVSPMSAAPAETCQTEAKVVEEKPVEQPAVQPEPVKAGPAAEDVQFFSSLLKKKR